MVSKLTEKRYMTIVCYVRSLNHPTSGMGGFCPTRTCGMLLRSTLFAVLTIASLSGHAQQFSIDTCSLGCPPTLDFAPADLDISCDAAMPAFDAVSATACAESPVEAEIGLELTKSNGTSCAAETAFGQGDDWALWFAGFEAQGYGASDNFIPSDGGLVFEQYANGTALLSGEVRNNVNPAQGFEVRIFLQFGQDFDAWTAQGRLYKDDLGTMNYPDWTYYEMVDTLSHLIGLDDMAGDVLYLDHMPVHRLFGFQVGEGANNRNVNHGVSGWFWYRGVIGGQAVNGTGDVNADLTGCAPLGVACPVVERTQRVRFSRGSCGHDYAVQTIDRVDMSAPVFDVVPPLVVTSCSSLPAVQDLADFVVSDDCSGVGEISLEYVGDSVIGEPCNQILYRTWRATDACGNVADSVQVAAIIDTVGPVISGVPSDVQLDCGDALPTDMPTALDACSENVNLTLTIDSIPGDCDGELLVIRTFTATDDCGNSSTASQTLTVVDQTAPEFSSVPADTTIGCGAALPSDMAEAMDFCSDVSMTSAVDSVAGDCDGAWILTRTFTATDACGNSSSAQQTVTVIDQTAPEFSLVPADTTIGCGAALPGDMAEAVDICSDVSMTSVVDSVAGDCDGAWIITRTFTATDACGNSSSAQQTVSVIDTVAPVFEDFQALVSVPCGTEDSLMAVANDACGPVIDITWVDAVADTGCVLPIGAWTRTYTATDACGNSASMDQLVVLTDDESPTFSFVPADTTIGCGAALPSDMAAALDMCSDVSMTSAVDSVAGNCDGAWILTRTFTATDACGNSSSAQQTVSVIDTVAPVFEDFQALVSVPCGTEDSLMAVANDACGPVIDITWVDAVADTGCVLPIGAWTRTYTATDACGNSASMDQLVMLTDDESPTFSSVPADTVIACGQELPEEFATAEDNCSGATVALEIISTPDSCDGALIVERIFTATDNCGNQAIAVQIVHVTDTVAPTFEWVPTDTTIACMAALPTDSALAMDICSGVELVIAIDSLQGDCPSEWMVTRTFTATDACGNSASSQQVVSIIDTVAPVFDLASLPADTLLDCASDIPTCENYAVFATDDCGTAAVNCSSETTPGACIGDYTTVLTFTATDVCGNQSAYNMTITVVDVTAPVCTVCPADTTVSCEAVPDPADPATFTVEEDCGTIEIELVQNDTTGTPCDYYVTRVWTFTDDCGNTSDHTQTLTVEDLTPPQIPAGLPSLDYDCTFEVPRDTLAIVDTLVYSDNCTDFTDIMVSYEDLVVSGDSTSNEFVLERIWTYTDQCGNVSMTTQEIVVDEPDANPELPSGLTPNGDGFNDTYYIAEIGPDPIHPPCYWADNVFTVFNRWGSLILEAPGYRNNWEGRTELGQDGDALPDGTYYVVFQVGLREFATFVDVRTQ